MGTTVVCPPETNADTQVNGKGDEQELTESLTPFHTKIPVNLLKSQTPVTTCLETPPAYSFVSSNTEKKQAHYIHSRLKGKYAENRLAIQSEGPA